MENTGNENVKSGGILNIEYKEKRSLYSAYMPFVKNGGLFIPTQKSFSLDDELFIVLKLPENTEKIPVACRVVWITPNNAQGNRKPGIGLQFKDANGNARSKIETLLAGSLKSEDPTFTM